MIAKAMRCWSSSERRFVVFDLWSFALVHITQSRRICYVTQKKCCGLLLLTRYMEFCPLGFLLSQTEVNSESKQVSRMFNTKLFNLLSSISVRTPKRQEYIKVWRLD